jgi:hypothetical protein
MDYPFGFSKSLRALKIAKAGNRRMQSTQEAVIRMKIWMQGALAMTVAILFCGATVHAQTDVALSAYRTIASGTTGSGTKQTPTDSEGGLFEWRHIANPLVGYEFEVTFNPANQSYIVPSSTPPTCFPTGPTGTPATCQPLEVSGKATQFGGTWILSKKIGNVRPFVLGGAGFVITVPGQSPYSVNTVMRPDFIYGGGVDWSFLKHIGLRLQVRGNTSKAPNLSDLFNATTRYTQVYEPMGGVFYRF